MNYSDFLFNLPNLSWSGVLTLYLLSIMRIAPIVALAPFLGAKVGPAASRLAVIFCLGAIFLPMIATKTVSQNIEFNTMFIGYALKELFIGAILGFLVTIPFYLIQSTGILIDYLRGASIMQAQDPMMQSQASPIGILYNYILIVLFFQIGGPFLFFDGLMKSYEIIPVDAFLNPVFFNPKNPFWDTAFSLLHHIVAISIQFAAPSLVAILMAEMFLGIANRLAPQVQIAFLGMSLKSLLGLGLLWAAWFFVLKQMTKESYDWIKTINHLIETFRLMLPKGS